MRSSRLRIASPCCATARASSRSRRRRPQSRWWSNTGLGATSATFFPAGQPYRAPPPRESIRRGVVLASEDRRRFGLILEQEIGFNLSLSSLREFTRAGGRLDLSAEHIRNQKFFGSLRIKAPNQHARTGG